MHVCRSCCGITATVTGTLTGCNLLTMAGIVVTFQDHSTATVLGTVTTNSSGVMSGTITLLSSPETVDLVVSLGSRFQGTVATVTLTTGTNTLGVLSLSSATGYECLPYCFYPWATSLTAEYHTGSPTGPLFSTATLTYTASGPGGFVGWYNLAFGSLSQATGKFSCDFTQEFFPYTVNCPVTGVGTPTIYANATSDPSCPFYVKIFE